MNDRYENKNGTIEWVQRDSAGVPVVSVTVDKRDNTVTENWKQLVLWP